METLKTSPHQRGLAVALADALRGLGCLWRTQRHVRLHLVAAIMVIVAGWWLPLSAAEWPPLLLCIGLVFASEALNSAIEFLADAVHPEQHPLIGQAKDVAAAGVLLAAIAALAVGGVIFGPHLLMRILG